MKDWKQAERRIASIRGGVRVPVSGRQRGDAPDILHPRLSVEVKPRSKLPAWIEEGMRRAESSRRSQRYCASERKERAHD